jgi:DNA-binding NarL/FixJ family response regulator
MAHASSSQRDLGQGRLRILVADDHEVVRHGVRRLLEEQPGWVVCGEARTGREAIALAVALQPDIVVLDVSMPGLNGIDATRRIRQLVPSAKVLVLTVHDSEQVVSDALAAGARGCVLKSESGRTLVTAIRKVQAGEVFTADTSRAPAERATARPPLTLREREVLQLLTEGHGNKEIATILGITRKTAETHRARMMTKLGLHSMSDLVRYAIRNRIIQP